MPKRAAAEMTTKEIEALKLPPGKSSVRKAVGLVKGLYIRLDGESLSWVFRYMRDGKATDIGMGSFESKPLTKARKEASEYREWLSDGFDVLSKKRERERLIAEANRVPEAPVIHTFGECADIAITNRTKHLRNKKSRDQWRNTLKEHCGTLWALPVEAIDSAQVAKVLAPIWDTKHETARRVRMRMEAVFNVAKSNGYRPDNPAEYKGGLDAKLPRSPIKKVSQPSLHFGKIGAFVADLREREGSSARALELLVLTATRTNETIGARWSEIIDDGEFEFPVWKIPADRMKANKAFEIPLCPQVVAILKGQRAIRQVDNDFIFPGARGNKPLSNMALLEMVRGMNQPTPIYLDVSAHDKHRPIVPHGFRSTFRDWAGDKTHHAREVIEHALAHQLKDKAEAAYRRSEALEKRFALMKDWSAHCDTVRKNVVRLSIA